MRFVVITLYAVHVAGAFGCHSPLTTMRMMSICSSKPVQKGSFHEFEAYVSPKIDTTEVELSGIVSESTRPRTLREDAQGRGRIMVFELR